MGTLKWLFGGIVGGTIGAAAWVAMEYAMQSEFAWMAWPVGLMVGWGVHKFAVAGTRGGTLRGAVAAVLALAAILAAGSAKAKIMTKQAARAATPAVVGTTSETGVVGQDDAEAVETIDRTTVELGESPPRLFTGSMESKPRNAFQNPMDMLWLCLAALTAYIVGKGTGASSAASERPASEGPAGEELTGAGGGDTE